MKKKRNLFEELKGAIEDVKAHRKGKITLRECHVKTNPIPKIDPELIRDTRENLHLSRAVFALRLRVSPRTLEKWEQGRSSPNDQAAALILMVRKFPQTLTYLAKI